VRVRVCVCVRARTDTRAHARTHTYTHTHTHTHIHTYTHTHKHTPAQCNGAFWCVYASMRRYQSKCTYRSGNTEYTHMNCIMRMYACMKGIIGLYMHHTIHASFKCTCMNGIIGVHMNSSITMYTYMKGITELYTYHKIRSSKSISIRIPYMCHELISTYEAPSR